MFYLLRRKNVVPLPPHKREQNGARSLIRLGKKKSKIVKLFFSLAVRTWGEKNNTKKKVSASSEFAEEEVLTNGIGRT